MSFKIEIEIEGCDRDFCRDCKMLTYFGRECRLFNIKLKWTQNRKGIIPYRCPECLEAEKQYEEKEQS